MAFDFPMFIGFIGLFIKSLGPPGPLDLKLPSNARPPKNIRGKANYDKRPKKKLLVLSTGKTDKSTLLSYNILSN